MTTLPTELILEIINYLNMTDLKRLVFTNKEICGLLYSTKTIKFYQKHTTDLIDKAIALKKSLFIFKTIFYSVKIGDIYYLLSTAIQSNNLEVVKYLVKNSIDVLADDNLAIRDASGYEHPEIVRFLINCGADVSAGDNYAIRAASMHGHLEVIKILVANGADITVNQNFSIRTASSHGHLEIVKFLVSCGADVLDCDDFAVYLANQNGHFEVVEFLIKCGATL